MAVGSKGSRGSNRSKETDRKEQIKRNRSTKKIAKGSRENDFWTKRSVETHTQLGRDDNRIDHNRIDYNRMDHNRIDNKNTKTHDHIAHFTENVCKLFT